jgi:hypothetical protein
MTDYDRDIGRHDEAILTLKQDVHALRVDVHEMKGMLSEAKGGIRALMSAGAIGGALGAAVVKFVGFLKGGS